MIPLVVVDTETGGLNPDEADIIEIAALSVMIDGSEIVEGDLFSSKVRPMLPVSDGAAKVNGYKEEDWADAPDADLVMGAFVEWSAEQEQIARKATGKKTKPMWTGSNPDFDIRFVFAVCRRNAISPPDSYHYKPLDLGSMCFPLMVTEEVDSLSLRALRKWAGMKGKQTHTAVGDVYDTVQVLRAILQ